MTTKSPKDNFVRPEPGDEVVISGIAGYFPKCNSVMELQDNLFSKVDLISDVLRPLKNQPHVASKRMGKINNPTKFDQTFFGLDYNLAHWQHPMARILLERTYEAIIDSGINPVELHNTKTGVFVASGYQSDEILLHNEINMNSAGMIGYSDAMLALLISNWLKLSGPAYRLDSACSGALCVLDQAYKYIREGQLDCAIVAGVQMNLLNLSEHFEEMGMLSQDGRCKVFDNSADGFVRAEAIVACILQKAKDSRRMYAQIVHTKSNSDGFNEEGFSHSSVKGQERLIREFYEECSVPPECVEYVECHGTGTPVGDASELESLAAVMCSLRTEPLPIGSIKSNMGHSECAAGLCGITKLCIAYNTGYIAPNINLWKYRDLPALTEGKLEVITDKRYWNRGFAACNSYGMGGSNSHTLLKNIAKDKKYGALPQDSLPRLVCVSGRTHVAVARILNALEAKNMDVEEIRLWHAIHEHNIEGHGFRGHTILSSTSQGGLSLHKDIHPISHIQRTVCFLYSDVELQRTNIVREFMAIPVFAGTIEKCHELLKSKNTELTALNPAFTTIVVQIAFTKMLTAVGIVPDRILGHDASKIACAYADLCLTIEEAMLLAYQDIGCANNVGDKESTSFEDICQLIPSNSVLIEISPQPKFEKYIRDNRKDTVYTHLSTQCQESGLEAFFKALGNLFQAGLNLRIANLYPLVPFPVSQGTPMLSHLVEWDHREEWFTDTFESHEKIYTSTERVIEINIDDDAYIKGHIVDGRAFYPAAGYIVLVWETLALMMKKPYPYLPVVFERIYFEKDVFIPATGTLKFTVTIHKIPGDFEITSNNMSIVTGRIYVQKDFDGGSRDVIDFCIEPNDTYMNSVDLYKLLHLKGYKYSGDFQNILRCNIERTCFEINWINNWVIFLDNMLQSLIMIVNPDNIILPTHIEKITIDVSTHYSSLRALSNPKVIKARGDMCLNSIRSAGVEIKAIHFTPIVNRSILSTPVLEKYVFFPFEENKQKKLVDVLRVYIQLVLENVQAYTFKAVEIFDGEYKKKLYEPLIHDILNILNDQPTVSNELTLITDEAIEMQPPIKVNDSIDELTNIIMVVGVNLWKRPNALEKFGKIFGHQCFIMSRESSDFQKTKPLNGYKIVSYTNIGADYLVLLRKQIAFKAIESVEITNNGKFGWVDEIKKKRDNGKTLVVYSQDEFGGLVGFINCLRKEAGGENVRGFLIKDISAPRFNADLEFYKQQLEKDFVVNVYENGQWGSYRHLLLSDLEQTVEVDNAYVDIETAGDLSSLKWIEGPRNLDNQLYPGLVLVHVYCASLDSQDVEIATGRARTKNEQHFKGMKFAGVTANGSRVMGVSEKALSSVVLANTNSIMPIPNEWSFEEAATVFGTYFTVYAAMVVRGNLKRNEAVLILEGLSSVGQAAINVALSYECHIFTTVNNLEERVLLKKLFPQIKDSNIGSTQGTSLRKMIGRETNGKGVDVVLNSVTEEQLLEIATCLAFRGRFLQIAKIQPHVNIKVQMCLYQKEVSFHGVFLVNIHKEKFTEMRQKTLDLISSGIMNGTVRPLTYCTFEKNEVIAAHKYIAAGNNVGRVVIKFRDEDSAGTSTSNTPLKMDAIRRYSCNPSNVYILIGGLGGIGLELAEWLTVRGAKKLVLVSRKGVTDGYQAFKIRNWKSNGVVVEVSTHNVAEEEGCREMLEFANSIGHVEAVFNVAMVLKDLTLQHHTSETFEVAYKPKARIAFNLDKLTRILCPNLRDFVMFSSIITGRGNGGQTNYGLANSVMERICEKRKKEDLPALAIQWGLIADVGYVRQAEAVHIKKDKISDYQSIVSCLQTLGQFMKQKDAVVSSYIPLEKKTENDIFDDETVVDVIAKIIGIKNLKTISYQKPLSELGMDSIISVEVKLTLENNYNIIVSAQEVRALTFARLTDLLKKKEELTFHRDLDGDMLSILRVFMKNFCSKDMANNPTFITGNYSDGEKLSHSENVIFVVPGLEGCKASLQLLCDQLKTKTCVLQLPLDQSDEDIPSMVDRLHKVLKQHLNPNLPYHLLGHSFGTILVLELAAKLENEGLRGTVYCIDGSPLWCKTLITNKDLLKNVEQLQSYVSDQINTMADKNLNSWTEFKEYLNSKIKNASQLLLDKFKSTEELSKILRLLYNLIRVFSEYNENNFKPLESLVTLIRIEDVFESLPYDYGLDKFTKGSVAVHCINSDHVSIVDDEQCASLINEYLSKTIT